MPLTPPGDRCCPTGAMARLLPALARVAGKPSPLRCRTVSNMPEDPKRSRDPEDKRSSGKPTRADSPAGRAQAQRRGHSGYGIESLRPLLRDQLELGDLLRQGVMPGDKPKRPGS